MLWSISQVEAVSTGVAEAASASAAVSPKHHQVFVALNTGKRLSVTVFGRRNRKSPAAAELTSVVVVMLLVSVTEAIVPSMVLPSALNSLMRSTVTRPFVGVGLPSLTLKVIVYGPEPLTEAISAPEKLPSAVTLVLSWI